ncbi:MAG TPA: hypothetical protein VLT86_18855 [Vicinamibacterales bacterium]|nr:hypothetical protein [Vicinamibacterales bacterium]
MLTSARRSFGACCFALIAGASVLAHPRAETPARVDQQHVFVAVTDAKGKPVKGLTKADFAVQIDTTPQEVLNVAPATEPASILILTDRLGIVPTYPAYEIHAAIGNFVKAVRGGIPDSKLGLITFDGTVITLNTFLSGPAELDRNLGKLTSTAQDAVLIDAIYEACKVMRTAPTERRVIFVIAAGYRQDTSNVRIDLMSEVLRLSKAALWAIEVHSAQGGNYENRVREQMLDRGSQLSGGLVDVVASPSALESMCKQMAEMLAAEYDVTYGPGGGSSTSQMAVRVKPEGLKVMAPMWTDK